MKSGLIVDKYGNKRWYKEDALYREDGPSVEGVSGEKYWWRNDKPYRENDLPHFEYPNGDGMWYHNGKWYTDFNKYIIAKVML